MELTDNKAALKGLVETSASLEKARVGLGNRISALERGVDVATENVAICHRCLTALLPYLIDEKRGI